MKIQKKLKTETEVVRQGTDEEFFMNMAKVSEAAQVEDSEGPKDLGEAYGMIAGKLADPQNIKILTELSETEIRQFAAVLAIAEYIEMPSIGQLINEIMTLKISKTRLGRKEMLELAQNMGASDAKMQESKMRRMLSLGGRI